jgi:peptidoglycan/xylan/chitin deacetylase (PgdA/CDA1 family)
VSHSKLASLPLESQRQEIRNSKRILESILGREVGTFSYPFGFPNSHYTAATVQQVRDAGYVCAFSAMLGTVRASTDVYQLPRAWVGDWDGDTFERRLLGWFSR